jgi:hypothetical protein
MWNDKFLFIRFLLISVSTISYNPYGEHRVYLQFYYAEHKASIFGAPLLTDGQVCSAAVLKNQVFLPQPSEL